MDYAKTNNRKIIPLSKNLYTFDHHFYEFFNPAANSPFISEQEYYKLWHNLDEITIPGLTSFSPQTLSLGWSGIPDYTDSTKSNTSCYTLKVNMQALNYQLALPGASDDHDIHFTTGEFANTMNYTVSHSLFELSTLTGLGRSYIKQRLGLIPANSLGIHSRNSADKKEPLTELATKIQSILSSSIIDALYIATDNLATIDFLASTFPNLTILTFTPLANLDSFEANNLHGLSSDALQAAIGISKTDQIGYAFADIWTLTQCSHFIPSNSEFSKLASYFRNNSSTTSDFFGIYDKQS